jgi:hypothetical protein
MNAGYHKHAITTGGVRARQERVDVIRAPLFPLRGL